MNNQFDELTKSVAQSATRRAALKIVLMAALPLAVLGATGPTWTTIDLPGAARTSAFGLNGTGTVVGDYTTSSLEQVHGFSWTAGLFTVIDVPDAKSTSPHGINSAGDIVGSWLDNKIGPSRTRGFLLRGGAYSLIDVPGAAITAPNGINDDGQIVGTYIDQGGTTHGFLLVKSAFTTVDVPGAVYTEVWRSNRKQIAGRYADSAGVFHVFLLQKGIYTTLPGFPGAVGTASEWYSFLGGLNESGGVCNHYCNGPDCSLQLNGQNSTYTPGSAHGYTYIGGVFSTIDFPGAGLTGAFDINTNGDIAGTYFTLDGGEHGYLRTTGN